MTLGIAGLALAAMAIASAYAVALEQIEAGLMPIERRYSNVLLGTIFGLFVASGVALRKRSRRRCRARPRRGRDRREQHEPLVKLGPPPARTLRRWPCS
jgi:hypothetical protein